MDIMQKLMKSADFESEATSMLVTDFGDECAATTLRCW